MLGIIRKSEPDEEFSWKFQYEIPTLFVRGIREEVIVTLPKNVPPTVSADVREEILDALCLCSAIRLSPIG